MPPLDATPVNDWITAPARPNAPTAVAMGEAAPTPSPAAAVTAASPEVNDWITAPTAPTQSQIGADISAVGQGAVSGTGAVIAGAGRLAQAGTGPSATRVLTALDLLDQGKARDAYQNLTDTERQQVSAYRGARPDDKAAQRAALQQTVTDYGTPNVVTRAGMAVEGAAPKLFPIDPALEGIQTGVGRMVGGVAPALAAGAVGGPVGFLASTAVIAAQSYDGAYQDAINKGATPEQADDAAGKSAVAQTATMVLPIGRLLPRVPVPLRDGLMKTLVNLGQHGVEFGSANAIGTFANNYVAQQTYDPARSLTEGTGQAGLEGLIAGLVIRGGATAAGAMRPGPTRAAAAALPAPSVDAVMAAPDVDSAIAAATRASQEPSGGVAPTEGAPGWGQVLATAPEDRVNVPSVLTTASGMKVPYRFDVVNAPDLTAASGDLQPRDRAGRMASAGQIVNMASNLDPELLHISPGPDQGAPVVDANGVVLAGNGRTAAIRQAHALGNGDDYRAMVERYGFDTTGMDAPVLIRRLTTDLTPDQARQFAVDSNVPTGQRMSGTEQAALDARGLTPDLLGRFNPLLTGGPTAAGNRDFVRSWVATLPQSERNAVMGPDGAISADGVRRLSGAMLARAYGDKGTLGRSLESTDDNARALTGALVDAAPAWAQLQAGIAGGHVPADMNVVPQLTRAVDLVRQAREKGQTVADVLAQTDAFNPIDPVTAAFVRAFYNPLMTRAASRPLVADVLRRYAIEAAKTSTDAGLFGDAQPQVTPADIIAAVTVSARKEPPPVPEPGAAALGEMNVPQSVGAAASREGTSAADMAMSARDAASSRYQGEVERLAAPPTANDKNVYIPGTQQSLAEITGDPVVAMEHQYNRQQPQAAQFHTAREDANADQVAAYYADTAGSKQALDRLEDTRTANATRNIQRIFGAPDAVRAPADPTPTMELMQGMRSDPRQAQRDAVSTVIGDLQNRLYDNRDPMTGKLITDPYALYGIGEQINDLLAGVGNTETSSKARVLKRELMAIKTSLYNDIEGAAPGFAQYRAQYQRDSQAISALKYLQDERLLLLGANQRITPAKWVTFMRNTVEGRADPMDPASALSEDQMDRLWNITDQLKRQTLENKGKPNGSWTSLMHEIGLRQVGSIVASAIPGGRMAVELINARMRERDVMNEMNRHLNPDMGQGALP